MKTIFSATLAMAFYLTSQGQSLEALKTSGTINYEEKMKLEIKLEGESAQFSDMLPKERTANKTLFFSTEASLYKPTAEKPKADQVEQESAGAMIHVQLMTSDDQVYRDLKENKQIEQRDFMSRMFLIESELETSDWKLTGQQKTILGFPCQEAVRKADSSTIRAWFTPSIPVSTGPQSYGSLPGMILAVDVNDGSRLITATSVDLNPPDKSAFKKPKEGKKVTREQFKKIVDEKMKEMGAEGGTGQHVVIKIQR
ncbi:MAG: GLPGLI family protein [Bacteroidota bacterium]